RGSSGRCRGTAPGAGLRPRRARVRRAPSTRSTLRTPRPSGGARARSGGCAACPRPVTVMRSVPDVLPVEVDDLTPEWMSDAMDTDVTSVTVLDRHSGTTGRAHLALTGDPRLPATVFVKLAPFDERQRRFVNVQGMGVVEARLYRDLAP